MAIADITDIQSILYTEKTYSLPENVIVVRTSPRVTKTSLREIFKEYFGINPLRVNSLNQQGKVKKFKGRIGKQNDSKKFYVQMPEGATIKGLEV